MFIFRAPGSLSGKGCKMRDKLRNLFSGRQGMDELAKFQFWFGLAGFLIGCFLPGFLGRLFIWLGIFSLISAFVRVPKGKGKIHIKCRCGYTLYRKT